MVALKKAVFKCPLPYFRGPHIPVLAPGSEPLSFHFIYFRQRHLEGCITWGGIARIYIKAHHGEQAKQRKSITEDITFKAQAQFQPKHGASKKKKNTEPNGWSTGTNTIKAQTNCGQVRTWNSLSHFYLNNDRSTSVAIMLGKWRQSFICNEIKEHRFVCAAKGRILQEVSSLDDVIGTGLQMVALKGKVL